MKKKVEVGGAREESGKRGRENKREGEQEGGK